MAGLAVCTGIDQSVCGYFLSFCSRNMLHYIFKICWFFYKSPENFTFFYCNHVAIFWSFISPKLVNWRCWCRWYWYKLLLSFLVCCTSDKAIPFLFFKNAVFGPCQVHFRFLQEFPLAFNSAVFNTMHMWIRNVQVIDWYSYVLLVA